MKNKEKNSKVLENNDYIVINDDSDDFFENSFVYG